MMPYVGLARHWTEPTYQWGGNQPQEGRVPKSPQQNQDGLYACPNTPQHARYPITAHWAFLSAVLAQGPWWDDNGDNRRVVVGGGVSRPPGEGWDRGGEGGGGLACVSGAARVTYDKTMTTSRGYRRHITGRSSAMGKRAFVASLESYHRTRVAGLVLFFALKLITIARRVVRRAYSPGGSGYAIARARFYHAAIARARFYHAASRTRAYTPTPQTVPTHSFADVRR